MDFLGLCVLLRSLSLDSYRTFANAYDMHDTVKRTRNPARAEDVESTFIKRKVVTSFLASSSAVTPSD
jgi:hypothetical protein